MLFNRVVLAAIKVKTVRITMYFTTFEAVSLSSHNKHIVGSQLSELVGTKGCLDK